VIAMSPMTAPTQAPVARIFLPRMMSMSIQVTMALAAAALVL
jgi:hypothetical protein